MERESSENSRQVHLPITAPVQCSAEHIAKLTVFVDVFICEKRRRMRTRETFIYLPIFCTQGTQFPRAEILD